MGSVRSESFEAAWPHIARWLDVALARRGIAPHAREDLIQETALRLFDRWDEIDKERPILPLATTISLNLMRSGFRRQKREVVGEVDASAPAGDVEHEALARLELGRVAATMKDLTASHRDVLLATVADAPVDRVAAGVTGSGAVARDAAAAGSSPPARSPAAVKMMRMRARRRLVSLLEAAGVYVAAVRLRVHQLFNEPTQAAAVAAAVGVVLVAGLVAPEKIAPLPSEDDARPVATQAEPARLSPAPAAPGAERARPRVRVAAAAGASADHAPPAAATSAKDESTTVGGKVGAEVDPAGDSSVEVELGVATARVQRTDDNHYSVCLSVATGPVEDERCGE